jgi:Tfp pilus assembly protein PilN
MSAAPRGHPFRTARFPTRGHVGELRLAWQVSTLQLTFSPMPVINAARAVKMAGQGAEIRDLRQQQLRVQQQMAEMKVLKEATQAALQKLQAKDELIAQRWRLSPRTRGVQQVRDFLACAPRSHALHR